MDLQLGNSIYQCNPRCTIEKRHPKNHLSASKPLATKSTNAIRASLYDRFESDHSDKQDPQRNNCLYETVNV